MPIYPQLQGDTFREKDEDEDLEKKPSEREMEWKRQLDQGKQRKIMENRIKQSMGTALPVGEYGGEEPIQPVEPVQPIKEYKGEEPMQPIEGVQPIEEYGGEEPIQPIEPVQPIEEYGGEGEEEPTSGDREKDFARTFSASQKNAGGGIKSPSAAASIAPDAIAKQGSAALLKASWTSLILSFGLTLFYIAFHFIGAYIAHASWFCKFGDEWIPPQAAAALGAVGDAAIKTKKTLEYIELFTFFIAFVAYIILLFLVFYIVISPALVMWQLSEVGMSWANKILNIITLGLAGN